MHRIRIAGSEISLAVYGFSPQFTDFVQCRTTSDHNHGQWLVSGKMSTILALFSLDSGGHSLFRYGSLAA